MTPTHVKNGGGSKKPFFPTVRYFPSSFKMNESTLSHRFLTDAKKVVPHSTYLENVDLKVVTNKKTNACITIPIYRDASRVSSQ